MRDGLERSGYLNLRVVARGVDTRLFNPARRSTALRQQWGVAPGQPVALYVGRLAPEKNMPVVVQAHSAMKAVRRDARLVLVGDGPARSGLQAGNRDLIFAGMRIGEDLAAHYASADVFLFPSTTETYGNVTVEAMASGLAVIAYDYAAAAEYIVHGRNGLTAGFDNAPEFIGLAVNLVDDARRITEFGRHARETTARIDWESVHEGFEAALLETVAARDLAPGEPTGVAVVA
jgi:glycosyltransferase involved in cell wall biosynthesis